MFQGRCGDVEAREAEDDRGFCELVERKGQVEWNAGVVVLVGERKAHLGRL